jgi:hypothetical protein
MLSANLRTTGSWHVLTRGGVMCATSSAKRGHLVSS